MAKTIKIGGASGYWGESDMALPQFLKEGGLDYIVFDYLAEVTMSIMAKARAKDPAAGYAKDFVDAVLKPNLSEIANQGVKIISNAGGVNPVSCARAIETLIAEAGLDLTVAVILGDDLIVRVDELASAEITEMFSAEPFPPKDQIASINAYLGAFPIAQALKRGADIIVTGRCVDSAVTLGACIHEFGWAHNAFDKLAAGSLAGHILECGPQATGGNYTDWHLIADSLADIGYPIAEISEDGTFICTKPKDTGGTVTVGTVGEQMLYEIGDPQSYMLPDVICDFSSVEIKQIGLDRVQVSGTKGAPPPPTYKVSATYSDGWRGGAVSFFIGEDASEKAQVFAESVLKRAREKLRSYNAPDYTETLIERVGDESVYGASAAISSSRSVAVKVAVKHEDPLAVGLVLKELAGHALAAPPGLSGFTGGRYRPTPVLRLFSLEIEKSKIPISIQIGDETVVYEAPGLESHARNSQITPSAPPETPENVEADLVEVALIKLAFGRSGDKGDKANIGILPRREEFVPWIARSLTEQEVTGRFAHFLKGEVQRFYLPGTGAFNFLLDQVLAGGGVASLRNDPQGKVYAQLLLQTPIEIPRALAESL